MKREGIVSILSHSHPLSPQLAGFTLVELLISITVLSILLMLVTPSFKDMLMNNRVSAETDALTNSLNFARNTALSQNTTILVCPFSATSSTTCGGSWQNGWIVITQPAAGTPVLLHSHSTGTNDATLSATTASVSFDSRGISTTQTNFKVCDSRGATYARSVSVLPTGFVQSSSTMGVAAWDGGALTCP